MLNSSNGNLVAGEVVNVYYKDDAPENTFYIECKLLTGETTEKLVTARPIQSNIKHIPIIGEMVLLLSAVSGYGSAQGMQPELYYLCTINIQGNIHHNALVGATEYNIERTAGGDSKGYQQSSAGGGQSNTTQKAKLDENFPENTTAKSLQPYVGDVLIEGRFGSTIRLSSTVKQNNLYSKSPNWVKGSGAEGDPILIIRASKPIGGSGNNTFVTEDFKKDDSTIALTTTQGLNFEPASNILDSINNQSLNSWNSGTKFSGKQVLINSGRIIFNSTQHEIICFAKKGVAISSDTDISIDTKNNLEVSGQKILLGVNADEPIPMGNKLKDWTEKLIDAIGKLTAITNVGPSAPFSQSPNWVQVEVLKKQFDNNLSKQSFVKQQK
jgi:hypothetical protein